MWVNSVFLGLPSWFYSTSLFLFFSISVLLSKISSPHAPTLERVNPLKAGSQNPI